MITTFTVAPTNASDAQFRAWVSALFTAVAAVGWVHVAQTGEIDPATVLAPTLSNTDRGFRVFRLNDALQATAPFFMKVNVGSGSAAANPSVTAAFGIAVDGSGNLSSPTASYAMALTTASATAAVSNVSGDTNRLAVALWPGVGTATARFFSVERTHDTDGDDTARGLCVYLKLSSTTYAQFTYTKNGQEIDNQRDGGGGWSASPGKATNSFGLDLGIFPLFFALGALLPFSMNVVLSGSNDVLTGSEFQHPVNGVTMNFLRLNANMAFDAQSTRICMRYD